jgi:GAF domain-containing protein
VTANARQTAADALTVLELLAKEVPPNEFDRLVDTARSSGVPPADLQRLVRARELALTIRSLFARRQQREAGLTALVDTARDLTLPYELDALLKVIARRARQLLNLDMSWVSFYDQEAGDGYVRTADGHATALTVGLRIPSASGVGSGARSNAAPFWTHEYLSDPRIHHSGELDTVVREEGLSAIMAVPLKHGDSIFGMLYVADRQIRYFSPDEVSLMNSLADLASVAIERTQLLDRMHAEATELEHGSAQARTDLGDARRVADAHLRLTEQMLGSGDLADLVALAGEALESTVVVRGADGAELALTGSLRAPDEAEVLRASFDARLSREPVCVDGRTWVLALGTKGDDLGTMLVCPDQPLSPAGRQLLRLTGSTASVALAMHRTAAIAESQVRDEFLDDLLATPRQPTHQLQARAKRIAVDLGRPHVVVVARPESGSPGRAAVWASSYAYRNGGLRSVRGGCIILLLQGDDPSATARAVARDVSPLLDQPVTVAGAGPFSGLDNVYPTCQEALRCLEAQTALGAAGTTASARELGFLGFLLSENNDVVGYIQQTLGPVLDYDAQRATNLAETLEAYFASGSSPTYAAELLHVHPNTVSRRLERISELLDANWQKPGRALEIQLALRLQRTKHTLLGPSGTPPDAVAPHAARSLRP